MFHSGVVRGDVLRRLHPSDLGCFQSYRSIPELSRYQGWSPMSEAEASAFLTQMNAASLFSRGQWIQLGIAEPSAEHLIGDIGMHLQVKEQGQRKEGSIPVMRYEAALFNPALTLSLAPPIWWRSH